MSLLFPATSFRAFSILLKLLLHDTDLGPQPTIFTSVVLLGQQLIETLKPFLEELTAMKLSRQARRRAAAQNEKASKGGARSQATESAAEVQATPQQAPAWAAGTTVTSPEQTVDSAALWIEEYGPRLSVGFKLPWKGLCSEIDEISALISNKHGTLFGPDRESRGTYLQQILLMTWISRGCDSADIATFKEKLHGTRMRWQEFAQDPSNLPAERLWAKSSAEAWSELESLVHKAFDDPTLPPVVAEEPPPSLTGWLSSWGSWLS